MNNRLALIQITDAIANSLQAIAQAGFKGFDCSTQSIETIHQWGRSAPHPRDSLGDIQTELHNCRRCKLWRNRKTIVFGEGAPHARLLFIGEAPGFEEDREGRPFVGAAGQLLTRIIQAMTLNRDDVYIGNIIKCRPPQNRNPMPEEIGACRPFLERQIKTINPEYICTLGAVATQTLLQTNRPISHLRGRFYDYRGVKIMPTYHPAYLLRNPGEKRAVWNDIQKLMKALGIKP